MGSHQVGLGASGVQSSTSSIMCPEILLSRVCSAFFFWVLKLLLSCPWWETSLEKPWGLEYLGFEL